MYTSKQILEELKISYPTLLRWEKRGFIPKPSQKLGRYRIYSEMQYIQIKAFFSDIKTNPTIYKHLNIRIKATGKRK